jgi:hypothetical protein
VEKGVSGLMLLLSELLRREVSKKYPASMYRIEDAQRRFLLTPVFLTLNITQRHIPRDFWIFRTASLEEYTDLWEMK